MRQIICYEINVDALQDGHPSDHSFGFTAKLIKGCQQSFYAQPWIWAVTLSTGLSTAPPTYTTLPPPLHPFRCPHSWPGWAGLASLLREGCQGSGSGVGNYLCCKVLWLRHEAQPAFLPTVDGSSGPSGVVAVRMPAAAGKPWLGLCTLWSCQGPGTGDPSRSPAPY